MKRFSRCGEWFKWINAHTIPRQIVQYPKPEKLNGYRLLALDSAEMISSSKLQNLWRLYYAIDLFTLNCSLFKSTKENTGETLQNFDFNEKDIVIAGGEYVAVSGMEYCRESGVDFILTFNNEFTVYTEDGKELSLIDLLGNVNENCRDFTAYYKNLNDKLEPIRLCVLNKMQNEIPISETITKTKEKGDVSMEESSSQYFIIATSLDNNFTVKDISELYRLSREIQPSLKRFKSILKMGSIPTKTQKSCEAWINCKIMIALLAEKFLSSGNFSFPAISEQQFAEGDEYILQLDF